MPMLPMTNTNNVSANANFGLKGTIMKKLLLITIFAFTALQSAQARDAYDRTFDSIYMAQKIYYSLDRELNHVYKKLRHYLSARGKRLLKENENEWIYRRDHRCAFPETDSVNIDCAVKMTRKRLNFLRERIRECQEIGCKLSKLY